MIKESALRQTLLVLTDVAKGQYELIVSSMIELAALRETVRGLDPTFADVLATKREQALRNALPITPELVARLDELTRILKSEEIG
ncbi:MAG TPA: hypothetical protein VHX49_11005 [Candidatus Acidoferrales bacterium]|nr:hypothetical protein [Candidatus Acidoferrales bacterium]